MALDIKSARLLSNPKIEPTGAQPWRCPDATSAPRTFPTTEEVRGCDTGLLSGLLVFKDLIISLTLYSENQISDHIHVSISTPCLGSLFT